MEKDMATTGAGSNNSTDLASCNELHEAESSGTKHCSRDNDIGDQESNTSGLDPKKEQLSSKKSKKKKRKKKAKSGAAACSSSDDSISPTQLVTDVHFVQPGESIGYSSCTNDIVREAVEVIYEYPTSGKLFPASDITDGVDHAHNEGQTETTGRVSRVNTSNAIFKGKERPRLCPIEAINLENEVKEVYLANAEESHDVCSTDFSDYSTRKLQSHNLTDEDKREGKGCASAHVNDGCIQKHITSATTTTDIQRCTHVPLGSNAIGDQPNDAANDEHLLKLKTESDPDKKEQDKDGNESECHTEETKMKNRSKKKKKRKRNKSNQNDADDRSVQDDSANPKSVVSNDGEHDNRAETITVASDELSNETYLKKVIEANRDKSDETPSVSEEQDTKKDEQNSHSSSTSFGQPELLPEVQLSSNLKSSASDSHTSVHANDAHKERVSESTIRNIKVGYEESDGRKELKDHTNDEETNGGQIPSTVMTYGHADQDSDVKKGVEIHKEISNTESNTKVKKKRKKKKSKEALGTNKDHVLVDDANRIASGEQTANEISEESESVASQTLPHLETSVSTSDDKSDITKAVSNVKANKVSEENDLSLPAPIRKQETTPESQLCECSEASVPETHRCAQISDRNEHDPMLSESSSSGQKEKDKSVIDDSKAPAEESQIKNKSKKKKKRKGQISSAQRVNGNAVPDGCTNQNQSSAEVTNGHDGEKDLTENVTSSTISQKNNLGATPISTCGIADLAEIEGEQTKVAPNVESCETCEKDNQPSSISQQQQSADARADKQREGMITVATAENYKMGAKISNLIEEAKKAQETGDINKAKQLVLQAMIAASEAKEDFLKGEKKNLPPQPLADWFGTCALILHETKCCIPAIKCFYTATVFEDHWSIEDHVRVAKTLWDSLLSRTEIVCKNTGRVYEVLNEVAKVAELALRRCLYRLCSRVCDEINGVFSVLVRQYQVCRLERYHAAARPVLLCSARAHYHTGDFAVTRSMCAAIVHEMSDRDCPEAFELWGLALLPEKEYELAVAKLRLALKYATETGYQDRLRKMLEKLCEDHKLDIESSTSKDINDSTDTDVDTGNEHSSQLEDRFVHTKSGTQRVCDRPRLGHRVDQTNNAGLEGSNHTRSPRNGSNPRSQHVYRNFNDESHSVESDDDDNTTQTHRQRTSNNFTETQEVQEVTTFYERSRRLYEEADNSVEIADSTLQSMLENGLLLNMSYLKQFENKHESSYTRNPYYNESKNETELREQLKIRRMFLRCELQIESAHVAICKPLEPVRGVETIEIAGRSKAGQAFNGDEVVVKLIGKKYDEDGKHYGQVEGVLKRNRCKDVKNPVFLCTIDDMQSHLMRPICKTIPKISVLDKVIYNNFRKLRKYKVEIYNYDEDSETLGDPEVIDIDIGDLHTYVFMVVYITWSRRQIYPRGAVIRKLECGENLTKGLMLLNLQHSVPSLYGREVIEHIEANKLDQFNEIDPSDHPDRENLTKLPVFTIDPEGSKDLDDALNVVKVGNEYKVGVHIADVSEIVMLNDAVDEEARKRATTFYPNIPGKLPRNMLPEPLSANACSLLRNKCRFALSVFFYLSADGELRNINTIDVKKTLIRSHEQFTYRQVQDIIEGKQHRLRQHIVLLHDLARKIRRRRLGNAMFAIDISGDDDDGDEGSVRETFEAHYLIEEFMIMANGAIARKLLTKFPDCTPLRCQPAPTEENVTQFLAENEELLDIVVKLQDRNIGWRTPHVGALLGTSAEVSDSSGVRIPAHIWKMIKSGSRDVSKLLCTDNLFPLQHLIQQQWIAIRRSAEYKCSGGENTMSSLRHFELEKYPYTHFTSPIRRYIDLVVHRLLHAAIEKTVCPYSKDDIQIICNYVNSVTKNAKIYQKECKILKYAVELKKQPKMVFCYADQFSDRCISLASSAMQNVNGRNRELPFNLLDMGYKPELVEDPKASKSVLTATWKKRLYDLKGVSTNLSHKKKEIILNSNEGVVYIPLQRWARILKCVLEERFRDLKTVVESTDAVYSPSGNADDVSTESLHMVLQPNTTFSLTFRRGQMLKVQLSAVPNKGLLTPKPTLYNMTHNVKLCLQHTDDPVFYLSKYFNRCTCDRYNDVDHYLGKWIPLMQMEAATCAVANEESCVIDNVPLHFFHSLREGKFSVSTDFCENRNIEFSGIVSENDDGDESSEAYDWMCIRYLMPGQDSTQVICSATPKLHSVWVGHAEITGVKREKTEKSRKDDENGDTVVTFKLHERCPDLPTEARGKNSKFCVEILRKSEVDRRTESFLKRLRLPKYKSCLAHTIALNKTAIPKLDKLHLDMARTMERDICIPPFLPKNNIRQQEAIDKAMNNRLSLIQGPPGTGKTYTGVKLMYLFDKVNKMIRSETGGERRQILFCGPSNKSVDLVGNLLKEKLGNLCPKFVRVYGRSIESIEYPIPGRTFLSKKSTRALKADERLRSVSLHHLIREQGKQYAKEINAYDKMFKKKDYVVSMDEVKIYMKLLYDASVEELKHYGVILCTTAVGSNPKILGASKVYQVIVDEAGMCPEPQCLMPVIATKAEQVVLIGDHKQLRPIIICKQAAELGLETSLFEKLAMSNTAKSVQFTMLDWQYRMNPNICSFPSERFYDGKLVTKYAKGWMNDQMAYIWPVYNKRIYPHVLIPVEGEEKSLTVATEDGNEHSRSNMAEVEVVIKILRYFVVEGAGGNCVRVISQYNAQCAEIRNRIKQEGFQNCDVSTVVSSQGGEWDYVIFSAVRSLPECKIERNPTKGWCQQNLGFITDQNQINVALTRAHKGLIIIGNPNLLRCDDVFRALISRYETFGCIKSPDEFPPKRTRQQRMQAMDMLNWERYGEERFIPGLGTATSFTGDVDNVPDDNDDDDGTGRRVFRRGGRKMLVNRQK